MTIAKPKPDNTASIAKNVFCKECGWPVIHLCCNDGMAEYPNAGDWYGYCSNKSCKNHEGEDWWQCEPEFTFRIKEDGMISDELQGRIEGIKFALKVIYDELGESSSRIWLALENEIKKCSSI